MKNMNSKEIKPIKGFKAFNNVFNVGKKFRTKDALAVFCKKGTDAINKYADYGTVYYGVTVPKKIAPKAVMRNRIRRILRVSVRESLRSIEYDSLYFDTLIITWRNIPKKANQIHLIDVLPQVNSLIQKANYYFMQAKE